MHISDALAAIASRSTWSLVLLYADGELGVLNATTSTAVGLMLEIPQCVVGIYWPDQYGFLAGDLANRP